MIANSTNISNRLFRTQKFITVGVLAVFLLFLVLLSISSHEHIRNHDLYKQTNEGIKATIESISQFVSMDDMLENEVQLPDEIKDKLTTDESENKKILNEELNALIDEKD